MTYGIICQVGIKFIAFGCVIGKKKNNQDKNVSLN